MLHQNDFTLSLLAGHRQGKLLDEAHFARRRRESGVANGRFHKQFLVSFAEILILSGKRLKDRCEPRHGNQIAVREPNIEGYGVIDS